MKVLKVFPMDCNSLPVSPETSTASVKKSVAAKINYSCDVCGAPFYHKFGLSTHKRRLHGNEESTTQTFVVVKKSINNVGKKRNIKIEKLNRRSPEIYVKNNTKNAVGKEVSEIKKNTDNVVTLQICNEVKQEEENVVLEICDVNENSHDNTSVTCNEEEQILSTSPNVLSEDKVMCKISNVTTLTPSHDSFEADENDQYNDPLEFVDTNIEIENVIPCTICETNLQDDMPSETQAANSSTLEYFIVEGSGSKLYECSKCSKQYKHKRSLNRHIQEVHFPNSIDKDVEYICATCNTPYKTRKNISAHLVRAHTANKSLCLLCQESFNRPRILSKHMMDEHCTLNFTERIHSISPVSSPVHPYTEQEDEKPSEEYNQTVFLPIECDILPVEFEITPKEEFEITPKEEFEITPKEEFEMTRKEQLEIAPKKEFEMTPKKEFEITIKKEFEITPKEEMMEIEIDGIE